MDSPETKCPSTTIHPAVFSKRRGDDVIRERFDIYMSLPLRKIETMRPVGEAVAEILAALSPEKK